MACVTHYKHYITFLPNNLPIRFFAFRTGVFHTHGKYRNLPTALFLFSQVAYWHRKFCEFLPRLLDSISDFSFALVLNGSFNRNFCCTEGGTFNFYAEACRR